MDIHGRDLSKHWHLTRSLVSDKVDANYRTIHHGTRVEFRISARKDGWNPDDDETLQRLCDYLNGLHNSHSN